MCEGWKSLIAVMSSSAIVWQQNGAKDSDRTRNRTSDLPLSGRVLSQLSYPDISSLRHMIHKYCWIITPSWVLIVTELGLQNIPSKRSSQDNHQKCRKFTNWCDWNSWKECFGDQVLSRKSLSLVSASQQHMPLDVLRTNVSNGPIRGLIHTCPLMSFSGKRSSSDF